MQAVSNLPSSVPGDPLGRGLRPLAGELFEREVVRARERQGGERAVEARAAEVGAARRAGRRAAFEEYSAREPIDEPSRHREPDAEPVASGGAPRTDGAGGAARRTDGTTNAARDAARAGGRPDEGQAPPTRPGGDEEAPARTDVDPQAASGAPAVGSAGAAAPAAMTSAEARGPVRAQAPAVAFVQAARGGTTANASTAAAGKATPPGPDTALIEHAAEVLRQIRLRLGAGGRSVAVDLVPEELGRLSIRLTLRDGRLAAVVRAESPQTLELLERQAPELRAILVQQGFEAEKLDLDLGPGGERGGAGDDFAGRPADARASRTNTSAASPERGERVPIPASEVGLAGLIDTYA